VAVGVRVATELTSRGFAVQDRLELPGSVAALTDHAQHMLVRFERLQGEHGTGVIELFHHRQTGRAMYRPQRVQLLPLDTTWLRQVASRPWPTNNLPDFRVPWEAMSRSLVRHWLLGALFQALAESLASENAKRLASMQSAEKNIEERIDGLRMRYHRRRQASITQELLDVVSGYEATKESG